MTIVQALKEENLIVCVKNTKTGSELEWNPAIKQWKVDSRIRTLCLTKDQNVAVDFLIGKRG